MTAQRPHVARVPSLGIAELRRLGRDIPTPFELLLSEPIVAIAAASLRCEAVLRCLPERRIVLRATTGQRQLVVKLHLRAATTAMHAEREGLAALAAAGFRVPQICAEMLITGRGYAPGRAAMRADIGLQCTGFIDDARSLAELWPTLTVAARRHWLSALSAGLGRLHVSGALHTDPHFENFLLAHGDAMDSSLALPRIVALDGAAVARFDAVPSACARLSNLALLHAQCPAMDAAGVAECLAAYAQETLASASFTQHQLLVELARQRARRVRKLVRKSMRDCSEFAVLRSRTRTLICRRTALPDLLPLLTQPDRALADGELLKAGRSATVARVFDTQQRAYVLKRYNLKSIWHRVLRALQPSRAEHAWRAGQRLRLLGIATATPVALILETLGPLRGRAFLLTEAAMGARLCDIDAAVAETTSVHATVAATIAALHRAGLAHGDLKASNVLIDAGTALLIDLDACTAPRVRFRRRAAQSADVERFLANWTDAGERMRWQEALDRAVRA